MMIAQITDTHVRPRGKIAYGRVDTNAMLEAAVAKLEDLPRKPDLVIASGDLTDCGLAEEYQVLRDILEPLSMPVYLVPGNHDRRAELFAEFGPDGYMKNDDGFLHYTIEGRDAADRSRHRGAGARPRRDVCPAARLARGPAGRAA